MAKFAEVTTIDGEKIKINENTHIIRGIDNGCAIYSAIDNSRTDIVEEFNYVMDQLNWGLNEQS